MGLPTLARDMSRILLIAALLVAAAMAAPTDKWGAKGGKWSIKVPAAPGKVAQTVDVSVRRVGTGTGTGSATPTPTASPTPAVASTITQTLTFSFLPSAYSGTLKTTCEYAYGNTVGIYTVSGTTYTLKPQTSISSTASRRSANVAMTVQVPASLATSAKAAADGLTSDLTPLTNNINSAKTATGHTGSITATGAQAATSSPTPTPTPTVTSGVAKTTVGITALVALAAALFQ